MDVRHFVFIVSPLEFGLTVFLASFDYSNFLESVCVLIVLMFCFGLMGVSLWMVSINPSLNFC